MRRIPKLDAAARMVTETFSSETHPSARQRVCKPRAALTTCAHPRHALAAAKKLVLSFGAQRATKAGDADLKAG